MPEQNALHPEYLPTLLRYYEEEVMGEIYFFELGFHFDSDVVRRHFRLLSRVERHAANMVEPLLEKYNLQPRSVHTLAHLGSESVKRHQDYNWGEFVDYMLKRYPLFMDDFHYLENLAPVKDRPYLQALSQHELAAIEFAEREFAGDRTSEDALKTYLLVERPVSPL